jgi:hypothetical protein
MNPSNDIDVTGDREAYWRSQGWGPEWSFDTTRTDGRPLVFSIRVPVAWNACDVMKLPVDRAEDRHSLPHMLAALARGIDAAGVIAIMGIGHDLIMEGEPPAGLFAVLTVALRQVPGPFPDSIPGARVDSVEFGHAGGNYPGVRIVRLHEGEGEGEGEGSLLTVQYLVQTDHGVLASTFATPQAGLFERLLPLLDKIAGSGELGLRGR